MMKMPMVMGVLTALLLGFIVPLRAFRPNEVDDDATTSLGHEIAHCVLGSYH